MTFRARFLPPVPKQSAPGGCASARKIISFFLNLAEEEEDSRRQGSALDGGGEGLAEGAPETTLYRHAVLPAAAAQLCLSDSVSLQTS